MNRNRNSVLVRIILAIVALGIVGLLFKGLFKLLIIGLIIYLGMTAFGLFNKPRAG